MITEKQFDDAAFPELSALVDAIDEQPDEIDAELAGDVLTLEFEDGARYIVNSHRSARQIWLAADLKAWHFDLDSAQSRWLDPKTSAELWSTLESLLGAKLGRTVQLQRPG